MCRCMTLPHGTEFSAGSNAFMGEYRPMEHNYSGPGQGVSGGDDPLGCHLEGIKVQSVGVADIAVGGTNGQ